MPRLNTRAAVAMALEPVRQPKDHEVMQCTIAELHDVLNITGAAFEGGKAIPHITSNAVRAGMFLFTSAASYLGRAKEAAKTKSDGLLCAHGKTRYRCNNVSCDNY